MLSPFGKPDFNFSNEKILTSAYNFPIEPWLGLNSKHGSWLIAHGHESGVDLDLDLSPHAGLGTWTGTWAPRPFLGHEP